MPPVPLLLVDPNPDRRARHAATLARGCGAEVALCADLHGAYMMAEATCPAAILIADELTRPGEFLMLRALIERLGLVMVVLGPAPGPIARGLAQVSHAPEGLVPALLPVLAARGVALSPGAPGSPGAAAGRARLVVIGASTGGIETLERVLAALPPSCPPVAVVQHIRPDFVSGLVRRLDAACAIAVRAAEGGVPALPGHAYIAASAGRHLSLRRRRGLRLVEEAGEAVSGHRPSVDILFAAAAREVGAEAVGVLLTGMGRDGAEGLLAIRRAGGVTIVQDRASSVVWGMPGAAVALGAAAEVLPASRIGPAIAAACASARRESVR